jgi:hypothetical protein
VIAFVEYFSSQSIFGSKQYIERRTWNHSFNNNLNLPDLFKIISYFYFFRNTHAYKERISPTSYYVIIDVSLHGDSLLMIMLLVAGSMQKLACCRRFKGPHNFCHQPHRNQTENDLRNFTLCKWPSMLQTVNGIGEIPGWKT